MQNRKMSDNRKFWDRFSWIYEKIQMRGRASKQFYRKLSERTAEFLDRDMNALELAMGPAMITGYISRFCGRLTATDFSEKMVVRARKKSLPENVTAEQADATNLRYADRSFDAVIIANALHIMPDPQRALAEICRVMKDDALLIAPTFTRDTQKPTVKERIMERAGFKTYFPWNHKSYMRFLSDNGFSVIYSEIIITDFPESFIVCKKRSAGSKP